MRLYLFHCLDGDDGARLRLEHRDAHLAYVATHIGDYAVAGPLKTDGVPVGSVLVIKGADEAAARARLGDDPYFLAGLWAEVGVHEFAAVAGEWVGGATWLRKGGLIRAANSSPASTAG